MGKPLKVINCGELLSKWVGESSKSINSIFAEGRHSDAILVFDEAEGLFGQRTEMRFVCVCVCVEGAKVYGRSVHTPKPKHPPPPSQYVN